MNDNEQDIVKIPVSVGEKAEDNLDRQETDNALDAENSDAVSASNKEEKNEEKDNIAEELENIKTELLSKSEKIKDLEEKNKKLYADFDNFRRRKEAEFATAKKFAAEKIVSELLPIIDNFERAIEASEQSKNYEALKEGLLMVDKQIRDMLSKEGLSEIEAVGKTFDPNLHQVVQCEQNSNLEDDQIIMELLKGYKLHDRIIRPSMVIVNKK